MQLNQAQLQWLVVAVSNAPAQTLDDAERKADVLKAVCAELRKAVQTGEVLNG